jgi:CDP-diacylglycerol--serine O-phosphatidyltransferase
MRHPDDQRWHPPLRSAQPFRRLIPNLITLTGLCFGLSAIRFAVSAEPKWEMAVGFIIAAAIIDGMDGRAARMLRATSLFGAQLDSLSDFVCFGVAPALVLYMWILHDIRGIGWAVTLLFAICCALRLARFNTALSDNTQQPWQKQFFTGVPSPAGGIICLLPLIIWLGLGGEISIPPALAAAHVALMGGLMVSRVPTFAAKNTRMRPEWVLPITIACALVVIMLIIEPWLSLSFLSLAYLAGIPLGLRYYKRLERQYAYEAASAS